ncbi:MAG TPA: molybdopterin-dependent oxidoreductase [Thermoanaerobaculia bacterium]
MKTPLLRIGERGEGRFKAVGWDEALDFLASRLVGLREKHGPESVAFFPHGNGARRHDAANGGQRSRRTVRPVKGSSLRRRLDSARRRLRPSLIRLSPSARSRLRPPSRPPSTSPPSARGHGGASRRRTRGTRAARTRHWPPKIGTGWPRASRPCGRVNSEHEAQAPAGGTLRGIGGASWP